MEENHERDILTDGQIRQTFLRASGSGNRGTLFSTILINEVYRMAISSAPLQSSEPSAQEAAPFTFTNVVVRQTRIAVLTSR